MTKAARTKRRKRPGIFMYVSEELKQRIERVCRLTGKTSSAFLREAALKQLAAEERDLKKLQP